MDFSNGDLEAEIIYNGRPTGDRVKKTFTLAERKQILDRTTSYTNNILKVFGRKL
jgi:hypothetical protein